MIAVAGTYDVGRNTAIASRHTGHRAGHYNSGMKRWLRLHGTITAALLLAAALTSVFGYMAVISLLGVLDPDRIDPAFARGSLFGSGGIATDASSAAQNASAIIAFLFGAVAVVSVIIIIGLILRQSWAREAGMVVYGFLGIASLAPSLNGVMADPPAPSAWLGVLTGLANLAIVGLLLLRTTARNFDPIARRRRHTQIV